MWKYVAFQGPKDSWQLTFREELEDKFFAGSSANTQFECLMPEKPKIKNLPAGLAEMEDAALRYLKELRDLPFYPGYGTCSAESMFFCRNA